MDMDAELRKQMDRLHSDMDRMHESLSELTKQLYHVEARISTFENMREEMRNVYKLLYGNSAPGIKGRIDRLEQDREKRGRDSRWMWMVMAGVAIAVVASMVERFL